MKLGDDEESGQRVAVIYVKSNFFFIYFFQIVLQVLQFTLQTKNRLELEITIVFFNIWLLLIIWC